MIIFAESASSLKAWLGKSTLSAAAQLMLMRMMMAFICHRGRMSCSQAGGMVASLPVHRSLVTRFLVRPRWQKQDANQYYRKELLRKESRRGKFLFLIDATLVSQAGKKTENTHSTGNRKRRPAKGRRYNKKKIASKTCHSFTFGVLITPSGIRIPFQTPHLTKEYCAEHDCVHRTTAEAAADMIQSLPLPEGAEVIVLGDTAYDAEVIQMACEDRGYTWIVPANPERVYEGPKGHRPKLRSRLKDWNCLPLKLYRLRASTGQYAPYRRLSKWRLGPKQKPREYHAYQEKAEVRSVGYVQLVFSTMKPNLKTATPDDVKILMTNAIDMSVAEVIQLYSLRWQIELFFKELKSTLGFAQYSFHSFDAVKAWVETAIAVVLFLESLRADRMNDRRLSEDRRKWWETQRLHGLCAAFRQDCAENELEYLSDRLKTKGGIQKLKSLLNAANAKEYRIGG